MQIQIIALGQKMPDWVDTACSEYLKRMPRELSVELVTLPLATRKSKDSVGRQKSQQAAAILAKLGGGIAIAMDEGGEQWSSRQWAGQLQKWMFEYPRIDLIIGGPDGLAAECRDACQHQVSLGRMTMPHALVRVVLIEQLYRAWSIINGHPYHRQ